MSLRIELAGFKLDKMMKLFGSGDAKALKAVTDRADKLLDGDFDDEDEEREEFRQQFHAAAQRAINEGIPFAGLKKEDQHHVDLAALLAQYGQKLTGLNSSGWKMQYVFPDFRKAYGRRISNPAKTLWNYLEEGRPLFGKKIDTGWGYYSYLSLEEVRTLHQALESLPKDPTGVEHFLSDMIGWLKQIQDKKLDLWLYAC